MAKANNVDLQFLLYLVGIVYPKYNAYCFLVYMVVNYCDVLKQQQIFTLRGVNSSFLHNFVGKNVLWDADNTVIVNDKFRKNTLKFVVVTVGSTNNVVIRKVNVVTKPFNSKKVALRKDNLMTERFDDKNVALVSYSLLYNLKSSTTCSFRLCNEKSLKYADEVEISLINSLSDWSPCVIDTCLKNYFKIPKILYTGDVITVELKDCAREIFYLSNKLININEKMYFKCNKLVYMGRLVNGGYLCATGKSTLRQSSNIQSFIPKSVQNGEDIFNELSFPKGLDSYFETIRKAVYPFTQKGLQKFLPIFLLEGRKGSGKSLLVHCLATHLGMHLYTINNYDVSANVYAQNETKLRNVFFGVKMIAPSILEIRNFENFGKNSEGEYDERLISHFSNEVKTLFMGNTFPLVVFCCSNGKNIPADLKRVFLKQFEIKSPTEIERERILSWILKSMDIETDIDLSSLANKTHGFLFHDLEALVHYATTEFGKDRHMDKHIPQRSFLEALDFMHSNYNTSLGAPKVPQVKWDDVGGLHDVKEEIIKTIKLPLKHPNLLKASGLKRSGILLFGPPGTGKTLIAKAVATECGLCFLSVKGPELLNMYVGQSEQNVREVFQRGRDASPCIIFFDELDSLAPNRGVSGDSGGVMDRVVSQLLAEMDGLSQAGTVFIIGATNRPDLIDPALLRPGRIDKLLYVGPCIDQNSKTAVLKALTRKFHLDGELVIDEVVTVCPENFSGADFYGICSSAWMSAMRRFIANKENGHRNDPTAEDIIVTSDDFKFAIHNIKPSISQKDLEYFRMLQSELK